MPNRKTNRRPQAPKARNWTAKAVRDPDGPYRLRSVKDRSRYDRKIKHPKQVDNDLE